MTAELPNAPEPQRRALHRLIDCVPPEQEVSVFECDEREATVIIYQGDASQNARQQASEFDTWWIKSDLPTLLAILVNETTGFWLVQQGNLWKASGTFPGIPDDVQGEASSKAEAVRQLCRNRVALMERRA